MRRLPEITWHPWLVTCVRPLLTWALVTVPRWVRWLKAPPEPQVLPPSWIARHTQEAGKEGDPW